MTVYKVGKLDPKSHLMTETTAAMEESVVDSLALMLKTTIF